MNFSSSLLTWYTTILNERFGLDFTLEYCKNKLILRIESLNNSIIFSNIYENFYLNNTDIPCSKFDVSSEGYSYEIDKELFAPGMDKPPSLLVDFNDSGALINYDILGLTYWMLNRIEEIKSTELDNHGRFPATSSHAFNHGYLERPIVDEWLFVLGQVIQRVWPSIEIKKHHFNMKVSHDVDSTSLYSFKPWKTIIRIMAGHLLKRCNFKAFLQAPFIKLTTTKQLHNMDPHNTFDWLMDLSEKHGLTSAFYFMCGRTDKTKDADYEVDNKIIINLMRKIYLRGHEIGLHPSYDTYNKPLLLKQEADRLRSILSSLNINFEIGGRMHFLRWEQPTTLQAWEDAGLTYDSTLCYADMPGFRCGTCFEYPAFNHLTQRILNLRIRPLIVMECTIIDERYLNLGYSQEAENMFIDLKLKCKKVGGSFTMLWHNSNFTSEKDFNLYEKVLKG